MSLFTSESPLDVVGTTNGRPAVRPPPSIAAARRDSDSPPVQYWFAFDRWLPIEEHDDFVLA